MTHPDSPLRRLLLAIAEQTDHVPQCLDHLNLLVGASAGASDADIANTTNVLDSVLGQLDEMAAPLAQLVGAEKRGEPLPAEAKEDVKLRLAQLGQGVPEPLSRWLAEFADPVPIWLIGGIREKINNDWRTEAVAFCRRSFRNRYPLAPESPLDVALADFGRFFGRGGVFDRFIDQAGQTGLRVYVDMNEDAWVWRGDISRDGIPTTKLKQLRFAATLQNAFFSPTSQRPEVKFQLTPLEIDAKVDVLELSLGGQQLRFSTESRSARVAQQLTWPGLSNAENPGEARLRLLANGRNKPLAELSAAGPWGWFRLLDQAQVTATAKDSFQVAFQVSGYFASFELQAMDAINPFRLKAEEFRCPQTL